MTDNRKCGGSRSAIETAGTLSSRSLDCSNRGELLTMSDAIEAQLDAIFASRNREDMRSTIDALLPIHNEHPENPRVLYEVGGAYDTAGDEVTALSFYERAMERGLAGDARRRCYLQYGSTLRNLGRIDDSLRAFARARSEFPESVALGAFEALTFHADGRTNTALASLLVLLAEHVHAPELDRYKPALRGNADYLASLDAGDDDAYSEAR
jgi:tetratricopeptide (TPR) repeat protein